MRKADGTSLPRGLNGHLIDRRLRDISERGKVLFLGYRFRRDEGSKFDGAGQASEGARREALGTVTYFVAMPFVRNEDGEPVPGEAQERQTANAAEREAQRMAETTGGAVAFARTGDPATGEFDDAVVLRQFGQVPSLDDLLSAK